MKNSFKKKALKIPFLIAAMVLLTIAAFSVYGVVRAAIIKRECNVHRYITINLDGGTSSDMYWKSNVDRDATNYSKGEWIWGTAAELWLRPKDATEDRLTSVYYDNQDPCEGTFYEHIDCVGATPYVWIEEPTKEGYEFAGWTYEVKTEIGDGGSWEVKEGKVSYDSGYYYFSAGAYATTGNSNGACANIYLTAKWEPIIYIDYSTDGGTIDCDWVHLESGWIRPNTGEAYLEYVSPDGSLNPYNDVSFNLRKTGYHFTQWTNNGRSGMDYGVFDQDTSYHYDTWYNHSYYNDYHNGQYVDLYPDWQLNYAKLDYNANGGYIEDSAEWALDPNGWVRHNGASGDEQYWAENVYYGQSCNPYNDTSFGLKKDGYRFAGWKIKGTTIMLDQDTTYGWSAYCSPLGIDLADGLGFTPQWVDLEAVWEPMYQIDVNGSLDGVIDYSQEWGTFDVYINGSLLENDQMDFMQSFPVGTKWEIKDIKSVTDGIKYVGDETYSGTLQVDTSVILPFMTDTAKYYKIAYDANGGTGTMDSQIVMYDSTVTLSSNQFKRSGYEFAGWSRDKNATQPEYANAAQVTNIGEPDSTVTLYAVWRYGKYTIHFNGNGATGGKMTDIRPRYDESITLPSNTYERTGYVFTGWNTKQDGSGASYADKATVSRLAQVSTEITLYAQWRANEATIYYNANGGSVSESAYKILTGAWIGNRQGERITDKVSYGGDVILRKASDLGLNRYGYTFAGWKTKDGDILLGDGVKSGWEQLSPSVKDKDNVEIELYASWENREFTYFISHDDGIEEVTGGGTHKYMDKVTIAAKAKKGYVFEYIEDLDTGERFTTNPTEFVVEGNRRLYVSSRPIKYTIQFIPGNGINPPPDIETEYEKEVVPGGKPERPGFTFEGWNTEEDGSGTSYADGEAMKNLTTQDGAKVPIYAQWKAKKFVIVAKKSNWYKAVVRSNKPEDVARWGDNPLFNETYEEWISKVMDGTIEKEAIQVWKISKDGGVRRVK